MDRSDPSFLGRGWHFPPGIDRFTGQALMVEAEADIRESLRILFQTRPGERVMQPAYGCRLREFVFEPMNAQTSAAIEVAIREAVLFFEPRITLARVHVDLSQWAEGLLAVGLEYTVKETNARHNIVFPFYEAEGTLISDTPVLGG